VAWGGRLLRPTSLREADEEDVLSPTTSPEGGQSLPLLKADGSADDEGSDLSPTGADGSVSGRARVVFADSHAAGRRRVIVRAVPPAMLLPRSSSASAGSRDFYLSGSSNISSTLRMQCWTLLQASSGSAA